MNTPRASFNTLHRAVIAGTALGASALALMAGTAQANTSGGIKVPEAGPTGGMRANVAAAPFKLSIIEKRAETDITQLRTVNQLNRTITMQTKNVDGQPVVDDLENPFLMPRRPGVHGKPSFAAIKAGHYALCTVWKDAEGEPRVKAERFDPKIMSILAVKYAAPDGSQAPADFQPVKLVPGAADAPYAALDATTENIIADYKGDAVVAAYRHRQQMS